MVASRDINPLELILKEDPAVVGPYTNTLQGCLQCFRKVDGNYTCTGCGFPMCNSKCEGGLLHREECNFFKERNFFLNTTRSFQSTSTTVKSSNTPATNKSSSEKPLGPLKKVPSTPSALGVESLKKPDVNSQGVNGYLNGDMSSQDDERYIKRIIVY